MYSEKSATESVRKLRTQLWMRMKVMKSSKKSVSARKSSRTKTFTRKRLRVMSGMSRTTRGTRLKAPNSTQSRTRSSMHFMLIFSCVSIVVKSNLERKCLSSKTRPTKCSPLKELIFRNMLLVT